VGVLSSPGEEFAGVPRAVVEELVIDLVVELAQPLARDLALGCLKEDRLFSLA
jgi:hypothetical protein